jgi:hypothetical protein
MGKILRKSSFFGPPQKKEERGHKDFCPQITTSCFFVYAHRILYIIFIKADILLSISFPATATTTTTTTTCGGVTKRKANNTRGEERDRKAFDHQSEKKKQSNLK